MCTRYNSELRSTESLKLCAFAMETTSDCGSARTCTQPSGCNNNDKAHCVLPASRRGRGPQGKHLQILAVVAANIVSVSIGTNTGWSTAVTSTLLSDFSPDIASWIVSVTLPACVVGCLLWGPIAMRFGPRKSLLAVGVPFIPGWLLLLDPSTLWAVLVGRALCGIAVGAGIVALPLYVSEITEDSLRGRLGSLMILFINFGVLIAYSLAGFLEFQGVAIFCVTIPFIFVIVFFLCPDSPTFLFNSGQESAALETLRRLRDSPETVNTEMTAIRLAAKTADSSKPTLRDLFRGRAARRAAIISVGVLSCQQGCGVTPVMYYAGAIFSSVGGNLSPVAASCIVGAVQIIGSCLATMLMDKAGRRSLMILSCIAMGFSQAALGYSTMPNTIAPSWAPVASLSVYIMAFALGAGPAPYVIVSEVSAPRVRAMSCSVAIAYNCLLSFVITKFFPDLSFYLGDYGVFFLFAGVCFAGTIFCWFCLPETSGRSSESIQAELEGRKDLGPQA